MAKALFQGHHVPCSASQIGLLPELVLISLKLLTDISHHNQSKSIFIFTFYGSGDNDNSQRKTLGAEAHMLI